MGVPRIDGTRRFVTFTMPEMPFQDPPASVFRNRFAAPDWIRKLFASDEIPFTDFMEAALYHPEFGYYSSSRNPVGAVGDFVTSPAISPVFGYGLGRLSSEFSGRLGDVVYGIVDIGCGDGSLLEAVAAGMAENHRSKVLFFGVDRSLSRVHELDRGAISFSTDLSALPSDIPLLIFCNELFDALPVARLLVREGSLREAMVRLRDGYLEWSDRPAAQTHAEYLSGRGIDLTEGQTADVSLAWWQLYEQICGIVKRGMIVTFDYGFEQKQLFDRRIRMHGTAAAYRAHGVHRELLADPGTQDLTAHVNFSDLIASGERSGMSTLSFVRQAAFLLSIGVADHELFTPWQERSIDSLPNAVKDFEQREAARRLILPDGVGEDIRVLVQSRDMPEAGWSFQKKIY